MRYIKLIKKFAKKTIVIICLFILSIIVIGCSGKGKITTIEEAKCVTEYPYTATVKDFDTVIFGEEEIKTNKWGDKKRKPVKWIVLEKEGNNAFLYTQDVFDGELILDETKLVEHNRIVANFGWFFDAYAEKKIKGAEILHLAEFNKYFYSVNGDCPGAISLSGRPYSLKYSRCKDILTWNNKGQKYWEYDYEWIGDTKTKKNQGKGMQYW